MKGEMSLPVIKRLPRYYRFLGELIAQDFSRISSQELSDKMGITASQIRQDLNCFGSFGQQGYGYNVKILHREIAKILGIDREKKIIVIGAGNLGRAIALHLDFKKRGFTLAGIFDINPDLCGNRLANIEISHIDKIESFCKENLPEAAVICIPKTAAQQLAERLVSYGIKAFWNFSHYDLKLLNNNIVVENVHLGDSLMVLSYGLNQIN